MVNDRLSFADRRDIKIPLRQCGISAQRHKKQLRLRADPWILDRRAGGICLKRDLPAIICSPGKGGIDGHGDVSWMRCAVVW